MKDKGDKEQTVRRERIYAALWRPRLWLGCNIIPLAIFGGSAVFSVPIAFNTGNLWWMVVGIVYLSAVIAILRWLARYDPDFFVVFWRYLRTYDRHFPAVGSVGSPLPVPRRHQR
jgi:type IV secretory pathway TrbD component